MKEAKIEGGINLKNEKRKDRVYDILSICLGAISLFFGFLIYAHNDAKGVWISNLFHTKVDFTSFNNKVNSFFDNFLTFNPNSGDKPVAGEITYIPLADNRFITTEPFVTTLEPGTIAYISNESDGTFSVVVYYSSFVAIYNDLVSLDVKMADRLEADETIGAYEESFEAYFKKGDSFVTYQELYA